MSRFTMTLLAAAAAAIAAAAVAALPAIGNSGTTATDTSPDGIHFAACLARHGLLGAPTTGVELKPWLAGKANQDPRAVKEAIDACQPSAHGAPAPGPDAATSIACVRGHGLDAPSAPREFKRWLGEQQQAGRSKALEDALVACKIAPAPRDKANDVGKCDRGAPTDKPPAAKQEAPGDTNTR